MNRFSDQSFLGWLWLSVVFAVVAGCASHGNHGESLADQDRQVRDLQQTVSHLRKTLGEARSQRDELQQLYQSTEIELLTALRDSSDFESRLRIYHERCESLDGELATLRVMNQPQFEDGSATESRIKELELENVALSLSAVESERVIGQMRQAEADLRGALAKYEDEARESGAEWKQERNTLVEALLSRDIEIESLKNTRDAQLTLLSEGANWGGVPQTVMHQRETQHQESPGEDSIREDRVFQAEMLDTHRTTSESASIESWWMSARGAIVLALNSLGVLLERPRAIWQILFRPIPILILLTTFGIPILLLIWMRRRTRSQDAGAGRILDRGVLATPVHRGDYSTSVVTLPRRIPLPGSEQSTLPESQPLKQAGFETEISPESAEDIAATLDAVLGGDPIAPQEERAIVPPE